VLHGASVTVVHHVFRPDAAFQVLEVGAQLPAHASALGKAMLAYAPEPVLRDLLSEPLPKLTNRTLTARGLEAELATVREQGYARERDEAVLGESSVAAPITDHAGHAVGAIGVVGETTELLPRGPAKSVVAAVGEAARSISRELGAARWPA
jgi:DNA-binding IclR family transcriptional regulator